MARKIKIKLSAQEKRELTRLNQKIKSNISTLKQDRSMANLSSSLLGFQANQFSTSNIKTASQFNTKTEFNNYVKEMSKIRAKTSPKYLSTLTTAKEKTVQKEEIARLNKKVTQINRMLKTAEKHFKETVDFRGQARVTAGRSKFNIHDEFLKIFDQFGKLTKGMPIFMRKERAQEINELFNAMEKDKDYFKKYAFSAVSQGRINTITAIENWVNKDLANILVTKIVAMSPEEFASWASTQGNGLSGLFHDSETKGGLSEDSNKIYTNQLFESLGMEKPYAV